MEVLIELILAYRYFVIFPLAMVEGPIISFIGGSLIALGYFDPVVLFLVLVVADVVPDLGLYALGRYGGNTKLMRRVERRSSIITEKLSVLRVLWETHTLKTMLLSKFAYGLSAPLLISAGLVRLPFRRFLKSTIPLSLAQYTVFLSLGYFFGNSLFFIENVFTRLQITTAVVVVMVVVFYLAATRIQTRLLAQERETS